MKDIPPNLALSILLSVYSRLSSRNPHSDPYSLLSYKDKVAFSLAYNILVEYMSAEGIIKVVQTLLQVSEEVQQSLELEK